MVPNVNPVRVMLWEVTRAALLTTLLNVAGDVPKSILLSDATSVVHVITDVPFTAGAACTTLITGGTGGGVTGMTNCKGAAGAAGKVVGRDVPYLDVTV